MKVDFLKRRKEMLESVERQFMGIDQAQIDELVDAIMQAPRIFVSGWGRAGNIVRILGMNMAHLNRTGYCVGDNSTPAITKEDLLIIFSQSGSTKTISVICQKAKEVGAKVALISNNPESTMGKLADINVVIPPVEHDKDDPTKEPTHTFGLSTYQVGFILNDFIEDCVMYRTGQTLDDIWTYHNNLE